MVVIEDFDEPPNDPATTLQREKVSLNEEDFEDARSDLSDSLVSAGEPHEATAEEPSSHGTQVVGGPAENQDGSSSKNNTGDGEKLNCAGSKVSTGEEQQQSKEDGRLDEERVGEAEAFKAEGNQLYSSGQFEEAEEKYTCAVNTVPSEHPHRAIYLANRAACRLQAEQYDLVIEDCTECLEINPTYTKALLRRAQAYEKTDKLEYACEDLQKVVEMDPSNLAAAKSHARLEPLMKEQRDKMKDEMIGKLKDLGNSLLGNFGLSLDNFQAKQDPSTGSYSINFQQ